ncbi:Alpha-L-glutamate ligase, RimK family [candidate division SR1 bacterium RAAC1_SR1_1]|nr:Alpha-L-glutamate ligase, RimK family [candidate division SR1 bacterium RAAC1_SR1_1]
MKLLRLYESREISKKKERFDTEAKIIGGIETYFMPYLDIYYDGKFRNIIDGKEIEDADIYWIPSTVKKGISMNSGLIYYLGILKKKKIMDPFKYYGILGGKFQQTLFFNHYGHKTPKTFFFQITQEHKKSYIDIIEKNFTYPFLTKDLYLEKGKGVILIKDREELINNINKYTDQGILIQECIENTGEYRILCVGKKIIGSFKRYNPNHYKNNTYKGTLFEKAELTKETKKEVLKMVARYGIEFAGIDLLIGKDGELYFLEINSGPLYKRAEEVLEINVVKELLLYLKKGGK